MRIRLVLVPLAAALAIASTGAAAPSAMPKLVGVVGINDAFKITLKNAKGKKVTKLKAGMYRLVVTDGSSLHNFVLEGPGVEKTVTGISFKGKKTVTVKLRKGKYKFYCRPHESSMFGFFTVTA